MTTPKPFSYYDLLEAFARPGCAICALLLRDAERFLDSLLYEYVTDPETNRAVRAGRGFCNAHSWQLTQYRGGVLGIAILYDAALDEVISISEHTQSVRATLSRLRSNASSLSRVLEPAGPCVACEVMATSERDYTETLGRYIDDETLEIAYGQSQGLCLPHFRLALRETAQQERLAAIQVAHWRKLKGELEEFIRKNDFNYADEAMGAEGDSWLRTIARMSGERGVFGRRNTWNHP
jgi:hypothetical protein